MHVWDPLHLGLALASPSAHLWVDGPVSESVVIFLLSWSGENVVVVLLPVDLLMCTVLSFPVQTDDVTVGQ